MRTSDLFSFYNNFIAHCVFSLFHAACFRSLLVCCTLLLISPISSLHRYTLAVLSDLASKQGLTDIGDDHIVAWANEKVDLVDFCCVLFVFAITIASFIGIARVLKLKCV